MGIKATNNSFSGWKSFIFDRDMFDACMAAFKFLGDPSKVAQSLVHKLTNACDMPMNKSRHGKHKEAIYWWTDEIAKLRKEYRRLKY